MDYNCIISGRNVELRNFNMTLSKFRKPRKVTHARTGQPASGPSLSQNQKTIALENNFETVFKGDALAPKVRPSINSSV